MQVVVGYEAARALGAATGAEWTPRLEAALSTADVITSQAAE